MAQYFTDQWLIQRSRSKSTQEFFDLYNAQGSSYVAIGSTTTSLYKCTHRKHSEKDVLHLLPLFWVLLACGRTPSAELGDPGLEIPLLGRNISCSFSGTSKCGLLPSRLNEKSSCADVFSVIIAQHLQHLPWRCDSGFSLRSFKAMIPKIRAFHLPACKLFQLVTVCP